MKQEYFHPHVWEKIKDYLTREKVKEAEFEVSTMTITSELAKKIYSYIYRENLSTFGQNTKNRRKVKFSYTPNFSVKMYIKNGSYSMCLIDSGTRGRYNRGYREEEYEEMKKKSMTKINIYFAIIEKYPSHLLDISYSIGQASSAIKRLEC